jgi:predicted transposase/invertase (TIGR01784 family)
MRQRKLISFDWALKKLLRNKANFDILEGFLSELLNDDIKILEILESEGNKEDQDDKYNRVDLKVKNAKDEIIITEVQYEREYDYLKRILYGTSKVITEHIDKREPYSKIVKVISVNIIYFDLGQGDDYVYKGITDFRGLHTNNQLQLSQREKGLYKKEKVSEIYPEYYFLKINQFNDVAKNTLDEWIYFLKNEDIKEDFKARGLKKAKAQLDIMKLSEKERLEYDRYIEILRHRRSIDQSNYDAGRLEGEEKGRKQGRKQGRKEGEEKGRKEGKLEMARVLKQDGVDIAIISKTSGISTEEIKLL